MKNNSFTIRCDVVITKLHFCPKDDAATPESFVIVAEPPSFDLHHHLGELLRIGKGADVAFEVGDDKFTVHRCVLTARSKVFTVELFGAMKERDVACVIRINDRDAKEFKALLFFVYTDSLLEMKRGEEAMYQHLLIIADKYDMRGSS
ncbi:hypothetical protein E2562_024446 [Oryza meyeriana var. granulata]|uniref:BTB domain-containing protein n=1 Tax=Oryza meyeriana var. granulata TaxID=110450 RepID=A0A6G1EYK3_9ORYZ|nr:hypothetical protein E2562_024446 [Oryza meyeriana var. granulata]